MADEDDETSQALIAHQLLNAMTSVTGSLATLTGRWQELSEADQDGLIDAALRQARHIEEVLLRLAQGMPADALSLLDSLRPREP